MKKIILLFTQIIVAAMTMSLQAQSTDNDVSAELKKELQKRTEEWRIAYNSGDARNLVPYYTGEADYISAHVAGLEASGRDKLIDNFQKGMNMGGHIDSIEILKMQVSCDLASLLCKYTATNSGVTVDGRNLIVMRRINNVWLISLHMTVV